MKKVANVNILRIYKNKEGNKRISDYDWKKDPNALIENLFFNYITVVVVSLSLTKINTLLFLENTVTAM